MLVDEISTKVKRWAIILKVETVGFLAHMVIRQAIHEVIEAAGRCLYFGKEEILFILWLKKAYWHLFW
ncbi:hypothetical protein [Kandleria vitulina]|uniref:hypothetical protein n=1 Tax=Kandleria vitulina TaxID=1630 RepID=UPI00048F64EB|nr:hypothetical protein [Kandleria vitulina]